MVLKDMKKGICSYYNVFENKRLKILKTLFLGGRGSIICGFALFAGVLEPATRDKSVTDARARREGMWGSADVATSVVILGTRWR